MNKLCHKLFHWLRPEFTYNHACGLCKGEWNLKIAMAREQIEYEIETYGLPYIQNTFG